MAADPRRVPVPPPPPPRFLARFVPFSTYGTSRPPSAQANRSDDSRLTPLMSRNAGIGPFSSQDVSHRTGIEISAFDISPDKNLALLAGREILKTVRVTGTRCVEESNLRTAIFNYASHNAPRSGVPQQQRDDLNIHDVKWSHGGAYSTYFAAAATSGKVVLYDLNRIGVELARLHEHYRQVHKLAFNPHQGALLLSASQDGDVRLWDLRDLRKEAAACPSISRYSGQSEGVRDVKWSPTDGVEFAFGTDNGSIQRWDYRNMKSPKLKINAHERICSCIDWHPDGKHLMSGSADKTVKVWDFSSEARRQKPALVLRTPHPVQNARWRPPCWSAESQNNGTWQCTQIATSYDRDHVAVHVWDFRRPHLPFRELMRYSTAPTDMLWHSQDLLWMVGREGIFSQTDMHFAPKVVDRRNLQAFAVSSRGDIAAFTQGRARRASHLDYPEVLSQTIESSGKHSSPEKGTLSRTSLDDGVDETFLSSSFKRHHGRTNSNRSTKSLGNTPPSWDEQSKVMMLSDSLVSNKDRTQSNRQVGFKGPLKNTLVIHTFNYLAQKYKATALHEPLSLDSYLQIQKPFELNADYAQRTASYRIAQEWRIAGAVISKVLNARAVENRQRRLAQNTLPTESETDKKPEIDIPKIIHVAAAATPLLNPAIRTLQRADHSRDNIQESTSNVPTPLARPQNSKATTRNATQTATPDLDVDESVSLPPSIVDRSGPRLQEAPAGSPRQQEPPGPAPRQRPRWQIDDLDERRERMGSWRAPPREPLTFDSPSLQAQGIAIPPRFGRHDSDESFAMFSASTESRRQPSFPNSFASGRSLSHSSRMDAVPEQWDSQDEQSSSKHLSSGQSSDGLTGSLEGIPVRPRKTEIAWADETPFGPSGRSASDTQIQTLKRSGSVPDNRPGTSQDVNSTYGTLDSAKITGAINGLRRDELLMRQSSSESQDPGSLRRGGFFDHITDEQALEASGTIVPEEHSAPRPSSHQGFPPSLTHQTIGAPATLGNGASTDSGKEALSLADFTSSDSSDVEKDAPFTAIGLLHEILAYHTNNLSDAQTSSHFLLLLSSLLPSTATILPSTLSCASTSYAEALASALHANTEVVTSILNTHISSLLQKGINPYQAESILTTYHDQLTSLGLFNAATYLRRLAFPTYPAVYEQALKGTSVGLLCRGCKSPINNPNDKMRCETCRQRQEPCPICWSRYSPFDAPNTKRKRSKSGSRREGVHRSGNADVRLRMEMEKDKGPPTKPLPTLWTWCVICGHGGHLACLSTWWADLARSEGACPTEGCLCDCVEGKRREERMREMEAERLRREQGSVSRDEWKVGESRAVGRLKGRLSSKSAGREDVGGRRVRLVEPDEAKSG